MIKYIDYKGSLSESMKTVQEFETREDLIEYLKKQLPFPVLDFRIAIVEYIYDSRINWNTHIVTIEGFGVIGFTNGIFPNDRGKRENSSKKQGCPFGIQR